MHSLVAGTWSEAKNSITVDFLSRWRRGEDLFITLNVPTLTLFTFWYLPNPPTSPRISSKVTLKNIYSRHIVVAEIFQQKFSIILLFWTVPAAMQKFHKHVGLILSKKSNMKTLLTLIVFIWTSQFQYCRSTIEDEGMNKCICLICTFVMLNSLWRSVYLIEKSPFASKIRSNLHFFSNPYQGLKAETNIPQLLLREGFQ